MNVLLINGSPHKEGCTYTALNEVAQTLNKEGIDTEIIHVGNKDIRGCIACRKCAETGKCVFNDIVNETAPQVCCLRRHCYRFSRILCFCQRHTDFFPGPSVFSAAILTNP